MKRHTCIICGRKRNEIFMENVFNSSWACRDSEFRFHSACYVHSDILLAKQIINLSKDLKVLNLKYFTK